MAKQRYPVINDRILGVYMCDLKSLKINDNSLITK